MTNDLVRKALKDLHIDYELIPCDPNLADTEKFCAAYGIDLKDSANAILVASKTQPRSYALCILLAICRLDVNGVVRKKLGVRKASFAGSEETKKVTGMEIGGVTPFGLANQIPIWIDNAVIERELVVVGGGNRERKLRLSPSQLLNVPCSEIVNGLAKSIGTN